MEEDTEEMHDASRKHEHMKHRMHIFMLLSDAVENRAYRIRDTAAEQPEQPAEVERGYRRSDCYCNAPAHADIARHRELLILFEVDGGKGRSKRRKAPYNTEYRPCPAGVIASDRDKQDRRIAAAYQKIYRAVVEHLKNALSHTIVQTVIDARHRIENNERCTVQCAADNAPCVAPDRSKHNAQHERGYSERAADDVRDHIEYLLALCIARQHSH